MALVADREHPDTGEHEILAVGRLSKGRGANVAEFAILVSDQVQGQGLGTELLRRLLQVGHAEKLKRIIAEVLPENRVMQRICEKLGFRLQHDLKDRLVRVEIDLT
jgi:acetyltransferase